MHVAQGMQDDDKETSKPREKLHTQEGKEQGDLARSGELMFHRGSGATEPPREVVVAMHDSVSSSTDGQGSRGTNKHDESRSAGSVTGLLHPGKENREVGQVSLHSAKGDVTSQMVDVTTPDPPAGNTLSTGASDHQEDGRGLQES